jgi:hypothetical protein
MKPTQTALCAALITLTLAGMASPSAWADGDKKKDKKGPVVVVGPITTTQDPPKKK